MRTMAVSGVPSLALVLLLLLAVTYAYDSSSEEVVGEVEGEVEGEAEEGADQGKEPYFWLASHTPGPPHRDIPSRFGAIIHFASCPFAVQLYKTLAPRPKNNVISPLSIHAALSMTMLGARGSTEAEMYTALGFNNTLLERDFLHTAYSYLLKSIREIDGGVQVLVANGVFIKPSIPMLYDFRQNLTTLYSALFESFQFDNPEGPEAPINSWISNQTEGKIQNLLQPETITGLTELLLVNTVYFKAPWKYCFDEYLTKPRPFYGYSGKQSVDTMSIETSLRYAKNLRTEIVELPYKGGRLALYILLPDLTSSLSILYDLFDTWEDPFYDLFRNLTVQRVRLYLPKFKIESDTLELNEPLQKMGMVTAFKRGQADFSGISANSANLHIDSVVHRAIIDVDESGTEAAAVTGVHVTHHSMPPRVEKTVLVNRPFLFVVADRKLNEILFLGTYVGPDASECI